MSDKIAKHSVAHGAKNTMTVLKLNILLWIQMWYIIMEHSVLTREAGAFTALVPLLGTLMAGEWKQ